VFSNSGYKNPVIGWPVDIAAYKVEDLQAWYQRWYAPNNATLVVVGDVDTQETFALAERYFAPLKSSEIKPLKPQLELEQRGLRKMTVKLPAKLPYLILGYKVPSLNSIDPVHSNDAYALEVLSGVLDGGNGARLNSHLVRGKQIASSITAQYNLQARLSDLFSFEGIPAQGKTVFDLETALLAEVKALQTALISPEELQRVKAQVLANTVYQKDSSFYQGMLLGVFETVGLGWQKSDEYVAKVNQVTAEQVRAVARQYLIEDHLNVGYLEPQPMTTQSKPSTLTGGRHAN